MGLFGKSKKHSLSPVNSVPNSPSSPRLEHGSPSTPHLSKSTRRASGFFDLGFSNESESVPLPAPVKLVHGPDAELSSAARSNLKGQKVSSFYESIPQISSIPSHSYLNMSTATDIPPVLLKPPKLSTHKREPSDVEPVDFDNFDGVYISEEADVVHMSNNSLAEAEQPQQQKEQILRTLTQPEKKVNTSSSFISPASTTQLAPTQMATPIIPSQSKDSVEGSSFVELPESSSSLAFNSTQESSDNPLASQPFQSSGSSQIEPQGKALNIKPITIPHVSESLRPPINSPSATAAAIASASAKSNLKIGTVRVVESQQANVEYGNGDFYTGFEGFSGQEISAENSQSSSDDDESDEKNIGIDNTLTSSSTTAPRVLDTITHVKSESDSSYVNVSGNSNDSDSLSSGVVVPNKSSPTIEDLVDTYIHPYNAFSLDDPVDGSLSKTVTDNFTASGSDPTQNPTDANTNSNDHQHQRYDSQASQLSSVSSFISEYGESESQIYHPKPQHVSSKNFDKGAARLRASVISTASSNILESSGGVPNFDTLSISGNLSNFQDPNELSARDRAILNTQAQLMDGSGHIDTRQSMPALQRRSSFGRTLSTFMPPGSSTNFRASHMDPPVNGQTGVFYPAPIPVELKLPPLLSKKNVEKAKGGRPISRRPGSMLQIGRMEYPAPPIWHVDNTTSDRQSFMSRRLSNASTVNAFHETPAERESVLSPSKSVFSEKSNPENTASERLEGNHESHADIKDDAEHDGDTSYKEVTSVISGEGDDNENGSLHDITSPTEGRIGELRDNSWRREPSWQERRYSQSILNYFENESDDDGIKSDAATIESDEEYQEDMLNADDDPESGEASANSGNNADMKNAKIDDFAFTSFNPNNAITDRGLLAGSISYSNQLAPAVGIQPPSLIEELEMRKAGRKTRLQRVYYDSTTGNAIATETIGTRGPDSDQLIRLPNSGHPLDYRHTKTLLELQQIANQDYEVHKNFHHNLQVAVESDRMSRMGLSTSNLLTSAQQPVLPDEEDGVDPNESLGARRARLKKKKLEAHADVTETLAERRARLKREKLLAQTEATETLGERRARLKREKQAKKDEGKENLPEIQAEPFELTEQLQQSEELDKSEQLQQTNLQQQLQQPAAIAT